MGFADLQAHCRCCACDVPMSSSPNVNLIDMALPARWQYPVVGNVLTGEGPNAVAVICDACLGEQRSIERVIEFRGEEVVYHLVADLREEVSRRV